MGGLASVVPTLIFYPMDTLRRIQQNDGAGGAPAQYKNLADLTAQRVRQHGLRSLYRGLGAEIFKAIPHSAVLLVGKDFYDGLLGLETEGSSDETQAFRES